MKRLLLFGGTTEARQLAQALAGKVELTVCVATEYGRELIAPSPGVEVVSGRLDRAEMAVLMHRGGFGRVVDATHPYAAEASGNIRAAAERTGVPYLRLERAEAVDRQGAGESLVTCADARAAADYLCGVDGNILLATGAKELHLYTAIPDFSERVYVRVLPAVDSLQRCLELGYRPAHILAMQGPFSADFNRAVLRGWDIETMVTKDGGAPGGFGEKQSAARELGVRLVVVGRPSTSIGIPYDTLLAQLSDWLAEGEPHGNHIV